MTAAMTIAATLVLTGGVTFYYGPAFEGRPLYCGGVYAESTGPWVALPVERYQTGWVKCGDWILIEYGDGGRHVARARDAGRLSDYRIFDSGLPFVADLPRYWREGHRTLTGRVTNLSAHERAWRRVRPWPVAN